MHIHNYDYSFLAYEPTTLAVWGESGDYLFSFEAKGTLSFSVKDELLEPAPGVKLPWKVPRIHAAKNVGPNVYRELLFESKTFTNKTSAQVAMMKKALGMDMTTEL